MFIMCQLVRILTKAMSDLGLEWESPNEPAKSNHNMFFFSQTAKDPVLVAEMACLASILTCPHFF